jgi:hypothetical protein
MKAHTRHTLDHHPRPTSYYVFILTLVTLLLSLSHACTGANHAHAGTGAPSASAPRSEVPWRWLAEVVCGVAEPSSSFFFHLWGQGHVRRRDVHVVIDTQSSHPFALP